MIFTLCFTSDLLPVQSDVKQNEINLDVPYKPLIKWRWQGIFDLNIPHFLRVATLHLMNKMKSFMSSFFLNLLYLSLTKLVLHNSVSFHGVTKPQYLCTFFEIS